jgi:hypothetical protein
MASTYSALKIELIGTGEQSGTWGATTNVNLGDAALGEAITGSADVAFSSADVTVTLTDTNASQAARNLRLNLTGTSGGARQLILGSGCQIEKLYLVNNGLADAVTVKNTSGTGIAVPAGKSMFVFNNGTNVVDAVTHLSSLTLGAALPITSGGTGSTSTTFVNAATNVTGTLPVANGGTGAATIAANNVILGNGTSAVQVVAPSTAGNLLTSNGTTWTSAAPSSTFIGNQGQVFTSSGTFTVPAGITAVKVTVVGGGGGGATVSSGGNAGGGGGGGGVSIRYVTGLTPSGTVSVTVGSLGSASTGGGTSSFGSSASATGGGGGSGGTGGAGGSGSSGDINITGGAGGNGAAWSGCSNSSTSAGAGGAAGGGKGGNGVADGFGDIGGAGGGGAFGGGADGPTGFNTSSNGLAGRGYGSGGSGGQASGGGGATGGSGTAGIVIVEW